ncbi:MAG TPA: DUF4097 family beta strand repeat-containing protein [Clostridiaceae bacterium]
MNKSLIKLLIGIWAVIALFLTCILIYQISSGNKINIMNFSGGVLKLQKEESSTLNNVTKLDLNFSSGDVIVKTTKEEQIRVVQKAPGKLKDNQKFVMTKEGDTLKVKEENKIFSLNIFNWASFNQVYEVYIPENYDKDVYINNSSGNMNIDSIFNLNNMELSESSGNITSDYSIKSKNFLLKSSSGNVKLGEVFSDTFNLSTSSGNINVKPLSGGGSIFASSGNIEVGLSQIGDKVDLSANSGNIIIDIPSKLGFKLDGNSSSGNINSDFDISYKNNNRNNGTIKVGDGPYKEITARTSSGNINISKVD